MRIDTATKFLLAVIAISLAIIAARPLFLPEPARAADVETSPNLYIEPGTANVRSPNGERNVIGKVIVDLNNGNVWGFPTLTNAPYPMDTTRTTPPVSRPIYLGKYDFAAIREGAK
jgi:hypothetical protein